MTKSFSEGIGIYIHIPFCIKKCNYCDFLSEQSDAGRRKRYVDRLLDEIAGWNGKNTGKAATVFIGGGTPSILEADDIGRILDQVKSVFVITEDAEITIEMNPETVTADKLAGYQQAGVNRLSIGLQSVHQHELEILGRVHSYERFLECYDLARRQGFQNINIDLMYGLPGQSEESWQHSLRSVTALKPEHISAYSLIIEEGTAFYDQTLSLPAEESERRMYEMAGCILKEQGYRQYEVSNYAKPGRECRHNVGYWRRRPYLGFGPGAASLFDGMRTTRGRSIEDYLEGKDNYEEKRHLTRPEEMEEFMFLGLRLISGISTGEFKAAFSQDYDAVYGAVTDRLEQQGLLERKGESIVLTVRGMDISNYVLSEFLL